MPNHNEDTPLEEPVTDEPLRPGFADGLAAGLTSPSSDRPAEESSAAGPGSATDIGPAAASDAATDADADTDSDAVMDIGAAAAALARQDAWADRCATAQIFTEVLSDADMDEAAAGLTEADERYWANRPSPKESFKQLQAKARVKPLPARKEEGDTSMNELPMDETEPVKKPSASRDELAVFTRNAQELDQSGRVAMAFGYQLKQVLGRGGQGVVHLVEAEDKFRARRALKVFLPSPSDADAESYLKDMSRMSKVASLIHRNRHDDLVDVEWFGEQHGVHLMLMQFIDGFDLQRLLRSELLQAVRPHVNDERWHNLNNVVYSANDSRQLAFKPSIAVYIVERILRGLDSLHRLRLVHGDIKPSNIMLDASGSLKIIDVGSAFSIDSRPQVPYCTPAYAATELLETGEFSPQSDLASLGYLLVELLSGQPVAGVVSAGESTRTIMQARRDELIDIKRELPDRLVDLLPKNDQQSAVLMRLCQGLIAPDPKERFKTAGEVINTTFEFTKELIRSNLAVSGFQALRFLLEDVKKAAGGQAN